MEGKGGMLRMPRKEEAVDVESIEAIAERNLLEEAYDPFLLTTMDVPACVRKLHPDMTATHVYMRTYDGKPAPRRFMHR
jgi:hypothetical protein